MDSTTKNKFPAKIEIIGINPFVHLPENVLTSIFIQAGRDKGKIPVKIKIDGFEFTQTLVKYSGHWRLYLNTPMRRTARKEVGDSAVFEIEYDPGERKLLPPPELVAALKENKGCEKTFDGLAPSLQQEIIRYLSFLKTEKAIENNIDRITSYLQGKGEFLGRRLAT